MTTRAHWSHTSQFNTIGLAEMGEFMTAGAPVLIVDDDPDINRYVGAVLGSRGIKAVTAYDAKQGFLVALQQQPRLILVDWHMPAAAAWSCFALCGATPRPAPSR